MKNNPGFTLVEVIVSMVVFALVVVGLSSVFVSGGKLIMHNRERMTSAQLGKFFLDPLQSYVRQDTWDQAGNELALGSRPGVTQSINNRDFSEVHTVADGSTDAALTGTALRRVISTISWTEPSS
ncbi:MAG: prepilin-type N-terminal cleavage/methylation domain-containing protein [Candidatus Omnitrophica bacterium]|nr:prepilin-type N-terminal cleavage/methylation domain-containing protein [Candidatus Omnitrophota bacterium]